MGKSSISQEVLALLCANMFLSNVLLGTNGIGAEALKHLAAHNPAHIYFSGRNVKAGQTLVEAIGKKYPSMKDSLTFIEMDLTSLRSVKQSIKAFKHSRLDILILNAGIMAQPAALSTDGYEIQFATNHLGHAMLLRQLLSTLLNTAEKPNSDVRVVTLSSLGYMFHSKAGIEFTALDSGSTLNYRLNPLGGWMRYAQSKLANILLTTHLAKLHPQITAVCLQPGVVQTDIINKQSLGNRMFIYFSQWATRGEILQPHQGAFNTVWCAAGAKKEELRNGGFYLPIGFDGWETLDKTARDEKLAEQLWTWTDKVLAKF